MAPGATPEDGQVAPDDQSFFRCLRQRKMIRHERHGLGRGTIRIPQDALDEYRRGVTAVQPGNTEWRP
jgi:hypothetical protein